MAPSARVTPTASAADHASSGELPQRLGTRKVPRNERMAQILTVAGRVFAQRGFHSSSMEEIARGAGVTKPLLYRYFGSKDALYIAAIEQVGQYLTHGLTVIMAHPDPVERLELTTRSFLSFVQRHRDGWAVLYNETLSTVGPVGERVAFFRRAFIDATAQTIGEMIGDQTDAQRERAQCLAHTLVGAGEAMSRWWVNHPHVSLESLQSTLAALYLPGLQQLKTQQA